MFSWLRRKPNTSPGHDPTVLPFKDANAAFAYACEFLDAKLQVGSVLPALVLDAGAQTGGGPPIRVQPDGNQIAVLRICSKDGGFVHLAATSGHLGPRLNPGDLVAWSALEYSLRLIRSHEDARTLYNGLIVAKLKPEFKLDQGWAIEAPFRGA
jgi:hypothetical protein